jgi:hypothetical protein
MAGKAVRRILRKLFPQEARILERSGGLDVPQGSFCRSIFLLLVSEAVDQAIREGAKF